jgi:hypothetical protein
VVPKTKSLQSLHDPIEIGFGSRVPPEPEANANAQKDSEVEKLVALLETADLLEVKKRAERIATKVVRHMSET